MTNYSRIKKLVEKIEGGELLTLKTRIKSNSYYGFGTAIYCQYWHGGGYMIAIKLDGRWVLNNAKDTGDTLYTGISAVVKALNEVACGFSEDQIIWVPLHGKMFKRLSFSTTIAGQQFSRSWNSAKGNLTTSQALVTEHTKVSAKYGRLKDKTKPTALKYKSILDDIEWVLERVLPLELEGKLEGAIRNE
jgi:hypothetical protein